MHGLRKPSVACLAILLVVHLIVLLAGFLAPYSPTEQNRSLSYAPPTHIHFLNSQRNSAFQPFTYKSIESPGTPGVYLEDRDAVFPVRFWVTGASYKLVCLV